MNVRSSLRASARTVFLLVLVAPCVGCSSGGGGGGKEPPVQTTRYSDVDGNGYSNGNSQLAVNRPTNFYIASELIALTGDCDDSDNLIHPAGVELDGDGLDQDRNGSEIIGPAEVVFEWTGKCFSARIMMASRGGFITHFLKTY